jgi:hypothetical protein
VDAAPLDPSVIGRLSPAELQEQAMAAAAEEWRRQHRKEWKELKRAVQARYLMDGDMFEGLLHV